jgi:putative ABC transport system permease protein
LYSDLAGNVAAIPGVRSASLSGVTPLGSENPLKPTITVPGYTPGRDEDMGVRMIQIYPGYFATLGIPVIAGREFVAADNELSSRKLAVINETMARRFFGDAHAVGRLFSDGTSFNVTQSGGVRTVTPNQTEVVGVVKDVRDRGPREDVRPTTYGTFAQVPTGRGQMTLLVRTTGNPYAVASAVRRFVAAVDPGTPTFDVETVAERVDASIAGERMVALLAGVFGALAVLLACVGLYGVMAYAVARRGGEFGIRMALGADPGRVRRLVLGESLALVAAGAAAGLLLSAAGATLLKRMLFGLDPWDPISFTAAGAILAGTACLASYLPARHASRVDPIVALRQE